MPPDAPSANVILQIVETGQDAGELDGVTRPLRDAGPVETPASASSPKS